MKKIILLLLLNAVFAISYGQLNLTTSNPQSVLYSYLGGSSFGTFNASQGTNNQFAVFNEITPTIGVQNGIVLTSSNIGNSNAFLPSSFLSGAGTPGYPLLSQDINFITTHNASVLRILATPVLDTLAFTFVYASNEYSIYSCTDYLDPMGIYISGDNPSGGMYLDTNIARVPNTNLLINTSSITDATCGNCPCNAQYFINNSTPNQGLINFKGFTTPITVSLPVVPGETYSITFAIADGNDGGNNCALFLDTDNFQLLNNITALPVITSSESNSICYGDSVILTSSYVYGNLWSTGDTTQSITVGSQGDYTVSIENNGTTYTSLPFTVTVNTPSPQPPTISSIQGFEFCPGSYIELISSNPSNNLWSTGETTQSIQVHLPGTFFVQENINGCGLTSDTITITHLPSPNPSINIWGAMPTFYFGTDMTNTNQVYWNFGDGSPIDSSINPIHTYTQIGYYQVQLIKVGDYCTQYTGDIIEIWNLDINEELNSLNALSIFPSPAQNFITVNILSDSNELNYRITDISGRIVQQGNYNTGNQSSFNLDISALTSGLYYLEANAANVSFKPIPFIKE